MKFASKLECNGTTEEKVKSFPLCHFARKINGIHTEIMIAEYSNRIMVSISQLGTFGTIIEASSQMLNNNKMQANIHVRLGRRDDPLLVIYARQLLELVGNPRGKPLILTIGLKDRSPGAFMVVTQLIVSNLKANTGIRK